MSLYLPTTYVTVFSPSTSTLKKVLFVSTLWRQFYGLFGWRGTKEPLTIVVTIPSNYRKTFAITHDYGHLRENSSLIIHSLLSL